MRLLEQAGEISELDVHPVYTIEGAFTDHGGRRWREVRFTPDFRYRKKDGTIMIEDVKPKIIYRTKKLRLRKTKWLVNETYNLRKRLFLQRHLKPGMIFMEVEG